MTSTLKLSAAAFTALLALAGGASAEGVKVTYLGKTAPVLHSQVVQAAREVCSEAVASDIRGEYGSVDDCVSRTVDATYSELRQHPATVALVDYKHR